MKIEVGQRYERLSDSPSWYTAGKAYEVLSVRDDGCVMIIDDDGEAGVVSPKHPERWRLVSP